MSFSRLNNAVPFFLFDKNQTTGDFCAGFTNKATEMYAISSLSTLWEIAIITENKYRTHHLWWVKSSQAENSGRLFSVVVFVYI